MTVPSLFPDYLTSLLPRILSSVDRDPFSKTRGAADRRYWAWKTTDYADATLSRTALLLHVAGGSAYSSEIDAMFSFLARVQHGDGSFDQAFPNEHSHGATAFLLADLAEICSARKDLFRRYEKMLRLAGDHLVRYDEGHGFISNHLAGAGLGLLKLSLLTGNDVYRKRAGHYQKLVLDRQTGEGWYPEYGGADPSYQTLCLSYLAQMEELTGDTALRDSLGKAVEFVSYFAHPNGSFGGEYGSRNCEILYPGGAALLAGRFPAAAALVRWASWAFREFRTVTPGSVDMENLTPVLSNVLLAEKYADRVTGQPSPEKLPFEKAPFVKDFPEAGLRIVNHDRYYSVINWKKGGVLKVFDKAQKKIVLDDCGTVIEASGGRRATTQRLSERHKADFSGNDVTITATAFYLEQPVPSPAKFLVLRLLNLSLWKIRLFREAGKKLLASLLILGAKPSGFVVRREIRFDAGVPAVKDSLTSSDGKGKIVPGGKFSALHMASSKYYFGK